MASLFRRTYTDKRTGKIRKTKKWYGQYTDADGILNRVPLSVNKTVAEQMLNALVRTGELAKVGITNPFAEHSKRSLREHLADWQSSLLAKGTSAKQVGQVVARARHVLDATGFVFMADVSASRVQELIGELREPTRRPARLAADKTAFTKAEAAGILGVKPSAVPALVRRHRLTAEGEGPARRFPRETVEALQGILCRGRSVQTANFYLAAVKQFFRWLVRDRRAPDSPLAHLSGGNVRVDRRHDRQNLAPDQLSTILAAALASAEEYRGLRGTDRHHLYLTAMTTGFRRSELATLTPESFDLDSDLPTITVAAGYTKNKQTATQPIPPEAAAALRAYLVEREPGQPVWPGGWAERAAEMLRMDLDAAGVAYVIEGPDGPLYADFHSLRHAYVGALDQAGLTLKQMMQLARHSDPKLTAARYGRARISDLGEAVGRMPSLLPTNAPNTSAQVMRATGTSNSAGIAVGTKLAQPAGRDRLRVMTGDDATPSGAVAVTLSPSKGLKTSEDACGAVRTLPPAGFEPATLGLGNGGLIDGNNASAST
jgi:integrase